MNQDPQTSEPVQLPAAAPATAPAAGPVPTAASAPAVSAAAPARKSRGGGLLNLLLGGALVLAIGGVAFAAGRMTAPASAVTIPGGNGFPGGGVFPNGNLGPRASGGIIGGPGGIGTGGGATIEGTVESITATTLTLKLTDGQTIQIALDGGTTYHAQTDASSDDVAPGGKVQVRINVRAPGGGSGVGGMSAGDVTVVP